MGKEEATASPGRMTACARRGGGGPTLGRAGAEEVRCQDRRRGGPARRRAGVRVVRSSGPRAREGEGRGADKSVEDDSAREARRRRVAWQGGPHGAAEEVEEGRAVRRTSWEELAKQ